MSDMRFVAYSAKRCLGRIDMQSHGSSPCLLETGGKLEFPFHAPRQQDVQVSISVGVSAHRRGAINGAGEPGHAFTHA
jgi:hypothetical protein